MKSWEYYNKIAKKYDKMYEEPYWEMHNKISEKLIFDKIKNIKNGTILDIGAGTGYWTEIFLNKGFKVYALEPSKKMCDIMEFKFQNYNNVKIINSLAETMKFDDKEFDIVIAMGDVLSYSEDQNIFIEKVYKVMKNGAYFIGTVDNLNKFILDAFFSKDFDIIKVMEKEKKVKVGMSERMSFYSKLFSKTELERFLNKYFNNVEIYGIMPFAWDNNPEFSQYWAEVLELEINYSKKFYDISEHLLYMVVK
ncbi:class I SAM-dependent methyltransferase [Marinitoga arctica]